MFSSRQIDQLKLVKSTKEKGLYYFQKALDVKSGPVVEVDGRRLKMISSYDYLGLIGNSQIEAAAIKAISKYSTGSGGVRLLSGTNALHVELEKELAKFVGMEGAITYTSGYTANLAVLSSLFGTKDVALLDSKIHQSTVDACKLAGITYRRFEHNNAESLERLLKLYQEKERVLIISEGIFSMDGDICDLPVLLKLKEKYGALLMLDEAHSIGVLGHRGRGVASHFDIDPRKIDIVTASLSKAIPANGGFVAGREDMVTLLQHDSTPYVFSAAMGPAAVAAVLESISIMKSDPGRFKILRENTDYFSSQLKSMGYDLGNSQSPVLPIHFGDLDKTLGMAQDLYANGILATPVVYPAVAHNKGILRVCITAAHNREYLDEVLEVFRKLAKV